VHPRQEREPMMDWGSVQIAIVLVLVAIVFGGMIKELVAPEVTVMCAVSFLVVVGILSIGDVLKVFSNTAPFTVACLFILSAALERTGIINAMGQAMARVPWRSPGQALLVMMLGVATLSTFVNNTPVVVILIPVVIRLAQAIRAPASKLLIPLSYATILGGTCSLVGTSTNILVDGVAQAQGLAPFHLFEITGPGSIMAAVGIAYIYLIGQRLLPERQTVSETLVDVPKRKFLTELVIPTGSPLIGKTLRDAGFTRARGFHLIEFIRDAASLDPEHGDPILSAGDRLVLRTNVAEFVGLRDSGGALDPASADQPFETVRTRAVRMMEGVVGPYAALIGERPSDLNLRRHYDIQILAIHRRNEKLTDNFERVKLHVGDTLLMEGPVDGLRQLFERGDLINLSEVTEQPYRRDKAWIAVASVVCVVVLSAFEALPIAATSMIAAAFVLATRCLDPEEAYRAIHWPILMLIFGMLALGTAMDVTGAGRLVVGALMALVGDYGPAVVLSMMYALTSFITAFLSNNAAAILLTPLAIGLAQQMGVDPRPFVVAVMFAASADFSTPIGYQTNTLVYAAGGYRFLDFTKAGLPLNILLWAIASVILPMFWPLD
jgi:di/tricarboxylate transporter